ncbi:MAG: type I DNA topoisomerase [Bacteroidales bacterium]|nr:type I DNA topoisomerase [Bacteroidales bacterium]MBR6865392.1 type I DNA topoisomerase [Bacteroidales bacterium]
MEGKNLVIVESPGKVRTIQKFLGGDYLVKASIGHIRDLQEKKLSVDVEHGFQPEYVVPADKKKVVSELKKLASGAETVWLASDEDREGEAISWHLSETLALDPAKTRRIVFHEITRPAILEAIQHPRDIDRNLVDAQQARRVLDRLVGFELSPVLWRMIQPKLSAGRVQSVALRLVVDREKEIMAFNSVPYYRVEAVFRPEGAPASVKVKALLDARFDSMDEARKFLEDSVGANYRIDSLEKKEGTRFPAAPFTTSTLQQEASRKLHFPVGTTMRIAQGLYERGLITYMRTDSTNLSTLALGTAKQFIIDNFGEAYSHMRQYRTKAKGAQEAHEAIRPTYIENTSIEGTAQEKKLYELIWKRTVASQMSESRVMNTSIRIASDRRSEHYAVQAAEMLFDGFMKVYLEGRDDEENEEGELVLPELHVGDRMLEKGVSAQCKYTVPPQRYSEATLVKKLEELEIGRPSTYATIISTLTTARGYVTKGDKDGVKLPVTDLHLKDGVITEKARTETVGAERGKLLPQEIGIIVSDYLVKNFGPIMDYDFTANVEKDFDQIAEGEKVWNQTIATFYKPFHQQVESVLAAREYSRVSRNLGTAPDGEPVTAAFGKFGAYVQKGEGENRQFASLGKGQLIETLTLEEALKLFQLPRTVGELDGVDVIATKGRFGPYLKYGERNIKLPRNADPLKITLDECARLIAETPETPASNAIIAEWGDIQIVNGRYGPYLKSGGNNYRIPKGTDAATLTEADCQAIIAGSDPTSKTHRRFKK